MLEREGLSLNTQCAAFTTSALASGMQVLEVLADDSNFRSMAMELSAAPAAAMLTLLPEAFESAWCAGDATSFLHLSKCKSAVHTACPALHIWGQIMGMLACQSVMISAMINMPVGSSSEGIRLRQILALQMTCSCVTLLLVKCNVLNIAPLPWL